METVRKLLSIPDKELLSQTDLSKYNLTIVNVCTEINLQDDLVWVKTYDSRWEVCYKKWLLEVDGSTPPDFKCECGAAHTSFPQFHSSFCPLYGGTNAFK